MQTVKLNIPTALCPLLKKYNLFDNVTSSRLGTDVKRIDVAVMLYNAAKKLIILPKKLITMQIHCNEFFCFQNVIIHFENDSCSEC